MVKPPSLQEQFIVLEAFGQALNSIFLDITWSVQSLGNEIAEELQRQDRVRQLHFVFSGREEKFLF